MNFLKKHKVLGMIFATSALLILAGSVFYIFAIDKPFCGNYSDPAYYSCKYGNESNTFSQACVDDYASHNKAQLTGLQQGFVPCPGVPQ